MAETSICGCEPVNPVVENEMSVDPSNLTVALTSLANEFGASAARRVNASDQLASDSQRMWSVAMTSPTVMAAHGMRVANESGAGRTRAETNRPENTSSA